MKVYELMAELADMPAGSEVEVSRLVNWEELMGMPSVTEEGDRQVGGGVTDVEEGNETVYLYLES